MQSSSQCTTCNTRRQRRIDSPYGNLYSYSRFPWLTTPGLWIGRRHATVPVVYNQDPMFTSCAFGTSSKQCDARFGSFMNQFDERHFD
uniref:Uncharacterized protein n=1 Tax=Clandestinovirus TaxID=2831644 RepID=A0A8F8KMF9_9VIRU|nr:hypothetical protein KOM_12_569 [Clandestinovirus]